MKIMVTGACGMLAADLISALAGHDVTPLTFEQLDICDMSAVMDVVRAVKPQVIINCAAFTKVDACESEAELAHAVNGSAPGKLAVVAAEFNAGLLHVSTDYVFDGSKNAPYVEDDTVNPLSVYGKSKLEGEQSVQGYDRHYIVRTQWLYGHNGPNFVKTMLRLAAERPEVRVVNDQYGSPTATRDLADAIAQLITTDAYGTYHITNSGHTSWYGFARDIFEIAKIDTPLFPIKTYEYPVPAKRPAFSPLENRNWLALGKAPLRGYKEALRDYLKRQ
jgi:dTDP-4-dehydrorhamnose reductase